MCSRLVQAPKQDLISKQKWANKQNVQLTKKSPYQVSPFPLLPPVFSMYLYTRLTLHYLEILISALCTFNKIQTPLTWSMEEGSFSLTETQSPTFAAHFPFAGSFTTHLHDYRVSGKTLTWMAALDIFFINTILPARIPSAFAYQKFFILPSCLWASFNSYRRHLSIHLTTDSIQTSTEPIVQDEESTAYCVAPLCAQQHSLCGRFGDFCCDWIFDVSTCYPDPTETF